MVTTILIFILILGILVLVHEFGHFIVAKKTGMQVQEFGFGFPPRLIGLQKINDKWKVVGHKNSESNSLSQEKTASTIYSINTIPFGGFVKIMGENNENETDPRSFVNRPIWARFLTLVAGVTMNWILAFVLFSLVYMLGTLTEIDKNNPFFKQAKISQEAVAIPEVLKDSPAQIAGLKEGDIILNLDGKKFINADEVKKYISENKGKEFSFLVKQNGEEKMFKVQSLANPPQDKGPTGIAITNIGLVKLPFLTAVAEGAKKTFYLTEQMFLGLGKLFTSKEVLNSVGGPVKIAKLTGEVAKLGVTSLMNFAGFLSINLAILNILPIPALDGGRVLFLVVEAVRRKRNNQKLEQMVNAVGFVLLLGLMLAVTFKDIVGK